MARPTDSNEQLLCSFCGKSQRQVKKLIAGPGVYICDECIDLCNEIIAHHSGKDVEKVRSDTERDYFMSAEEALEYGLVDSVLNKR